MKHPFPIKKGFTLVELMVVVAIIGILAAVGIPSFKKYQAQSKTTEAKLQMAAGYSALTAFQAEYDTYANCFPAMGYDPSSASSTRSYTVGAISCVGNIGMDCKVNIYARSNGAIDCVDTYRTTGTSGVSYFPAGLAVSGRLYVFGGGAVDYMSSIGGFIFTAQGYISPPPLPRDAWQITQDKNVTHPLKGY